MTRAADLFGDVDFSSSFPTRCGRFPQLRYMGSKFRLLEWIHQVLASLDFESALDAFSGSGCVGYLFKAMGKRVVANDFLDFPRHIGVATIENGRYRLSPAHCASLCQERPDGEHFIEETFRGIFFTPEDLRFLDTVWSNLDLLPTRFHRSIALAAMTRACVKRQPRGVFTVAGGGENYDDGRRDLRLSLKEQFIECVEAYNSVVFDNGKDCLATRSDVLSSAVPHVDLAYFDPPYVPRADDNCYVKRYHFLEGLVSYWRGANTEIDRGTKVRKIAKRYTPFSYRKTAIGAFDQLFRNFRDSILVLSYSSNAYPDLETLIRMMRRYKRSVEAVERQHRYHFGTHQGVSAERALVKEYLIVGT